MTVLNVRVFRKEADAYQFMHWVSRQPGIRSVRKYATESRSVPPRWFVKWAVDEESAVPSTA